MSYYDLLNDFWQWCKTNYLPGASRLLYREILAVFNEAGWPESVQLDNYRLMSMVDTRTERVAIAARDKLVDAGFVMYSKGKKGSPGRYSIAKDGLTDFESVNPQCIRSENDSESAVNPQCIVSETVRHIKNKTKNKTKINTNNNDNARAQVCDDGLSRVMSAYLDKISPTPSESSIQELTGFYRKMGAEVCLKAIDRALDAGTQAANWNYIRGILRNLLQQGVKCITDWDKLDAQHKQSRDTRTKLKTTGGMASGDYEYQGDDSL